MTADRLSVVIVTYRSAPVVGATLRALAPQLRPGDEVIVVDNASDDDSIAVTRAHLPGARILESRANQGFPAACNEGAAAAGGDILVFLNPDAVPQPGWADAIRRPAADGRGWAAWQALVTAEDGRVVNTAGNVVHFTGVAWAGQAGTPVEQADVGPREVAYCSGACLAVLRSWFAQVGGFEPSFFLYHEDLDLSLRLRLAGGRLGIEPAARVDHGYEFAKGGYKWRLMERNRWATLVRDWPLGVLVAAAPVLVAAEAGIWLAAATGGWGREKVAATRESVRLLPRWLRERRAIERRITTAEFARWLTPELSSPFLGPVARVPLVQAVLRAYWTLALRALA